MGVLVSRLPLAEGTVALPFAVRTGTTSGALRRGVVSLVAVTSSPSSIGSADFMFAKSRSKVAILYVNDAAVSLSYCSPVRHAHKTVETDEDKSRCSKARKVRVIVKVRQSAAYAQRACLLCSHRSHRMPNKWVEGPGVIRSDLGSFPSGETEMNFSVPHVFCPVQPRID